MRNSDGSTYRFAVSNTTYRIVGFDIENFDIYNNINTKYRTIVEKTKDCI